jgi:hypothetical protein
MIKICVAILLTSKFLVKSSQVNNLPKAKSKTRSQVKSIQYSPQSKAQNPQQAEQGHAQMQQCV